MDEDTRLRLEYDNGSELLRGLTETRFRLLALVPTVAGAVVALVNGHQSAVALLAIGLLGLCASFGVLLYELRTARYRVPLRSASPRSSACCFRTDRSSEPPSAGGAISSHGVRCEPSARQAPPVPAASRSERRSASSSPSRSSGSSVRADLGEELQQRLGDELWLA